MRRTQLAAAVHDLVAHVLDEQRVQLGKGLRQRLARLCIKSMVGCKQGGQSRSVH